MKAPRRRDTPPVACSVRLPHRDAVRDNPAFTLKLVETSRRPKGIDRAVRYRGHHYALEPEAGYQWNKKAFVLLYQLFQMTVVKPAAGGPSIAIAK